MYRKPGINANQRGRFCIFHILAAVRYSLRQHEKLHRRLEKYCLFAVFPFLVFDNTYTFWYNMFRRKAGTPLGGWTRKKASQHYVGYLKRT